MRIILIILFVVFYFSVYAKDSDLNNSTMENAQAHYKKGKEYSLKGDYHKANEEFKKAQDLLAKGEAKGEAVRYELKRENVPGIESIIKNAEDAASSGNDKDAIMYYLELLHFVPADGNIHYNLGVEYLKRRDYFDAAQEFMQAVRLNPKDGDACYNLGILYEVFLNDKRMANIYYKKYLNINPKAGDRDIVEGWIDSLENKK